MVNWRRQIEQGWRSISFGGLQIKTHDGQHHFKVAANLAGVDPEAVRVELFAEEPEGRVRREVMARENKVPDREGSYVFTAQVPATRLASDFTSRLIPYFSVLACRLNYP